MLVDTHAVAGSDFIVREDSSVMDLKSGYSALRWGHGKEARDTALTTADFLSGEASHIVHADTANVEVSEASRHPSFGPLPVTSRG